MSTYSWPAAWKGWNFTAVVQENQRVFTGTFSPVPQVLDLMGDLWNFSMDLPDGVDQIDGAAIQAFLARLRGALHLVAMPMLHRPVPQGTLRDGAAISMVNGSGAALSVVNGSGAALTVVSGTPVLADPVTQRASSTVILTFPGRTLRAGDYFGMVNGQTVMNLVDTVADANGRMPVEFTPKARDDMAAHTLIAWNSPTVSYRLKTGPVPVVFRKGVYEGPSIEGIEVPSNFF